MRYNSERVRDDRENKSFHVRLVHSGFATLHPTYDKNVKQKKKTVKHLPLSIRSDNVEGTFSQFFWMVTKHFLFPEHFLYAVSLQIAYVVLGNKTGKRHLINCKTKRSKYSH